MTGVVLLDGQPVSGATVAFLPATGSADAAPAQAVTGADGTFEVVSSFDQGRTTKRGMTPIMWREWSCLLWLFIFVLLPQKRK